MHPSIIKYHNTSQTMDLTKGDHSVVRLRINRIEIE